MGLVRDIPFTLIAIPDRLLATCAALVTTGSTGVVTPIADTSADAVISTGDLGAISDGVFAGMGTANGTIIDRLRQPLGTHYEACVVGAWIASTRGSTEADRKLAVGLKLQHGDSSGGGDMADYSTGSQPSDRQYFSTARTSDMAQWDASESTGPVYAVSDPGYYDLRVAKQYLRVVGRYGKNKVTTESSGDEQSRAGATITFLSGRNVPANADTTGPYSTTTST